MKTPSKAALLLILALSTTSYEVSAETSIKPEASSSGLILEIDLKALNEQLQNTPEIHTFHASNEKRKTDVVSKGIVRAKKVLKRITSLRYRKNQKLRALIGKSSATVQYTHKL